MDPATAAALSAAGLDAQWALDVVRRTLREDLGGDGPHEDGGPAAAAHRGHDVTSEATLPTEQLGTAQLVARADGVLAGVVLLPLVLAETAAMLGRPTPTAEVHMADGSAVQRGDVVATLTGEVRTMLIAERSALNLICQASGVATHAAAWTRELEGTGAQVLDTRKTVPGLRALQKYAVRCGGGSNKRLGLYDVAMIKDNHKIACGSLAEAYRRVRERFGDVEIQVEATTPEEAVEAVAAGARFLLLDNMSPEILRESVLKARAATDEPIELEATGGLTLDVAHAYGSTGVDFLSVGGLTHSSVVLDLALDMVEGDVSSA